MNGIAIGRSSSSSCREPMSSVTECAESEKWQLRAKAWLRREEGGEGGLASGELGV